MYMHPHPFVQGLGRSTWSRLVTVGHGRSRGGLSTFSCGRFFWSRLVTGGHGLGPCVSMNIMLKKKLKQVKFIGIQGEEILECKLVF